MTTAAPLLALLLAASPFRAEQPEVRAGNEALGRGEAAAALPRYDQAEGQVGPHPEIDFDRGNALLEAGRAEEARAAWKKAAEKAGGPLASRALQNTASALDTAGDREGAIGALGEALRMDPANEDARYNLEVLLRRKAEGKGAPKDPGDQGAKRPEGKPTEGSGGKKDQTEAGAQGGRPDPRDGDQKRDGQGQDRRQERPGRDQQQGAAGEPRGADRDGDAGRSGSIEKQQAERLLDALRSRERAMPLSRAGTARPGRRETARDW